MPDIKRKETKERLKYTFSDAEKLELGIELARELQDLGIHEDELTDIKATFKAKIEKAQASIKLVQGKIYSGYDYRYIECERVRDYETKEVYLIRLDTEEEVERRVMTQDELQKSII